MQTTLCKIQIFKSICISLSYREGNSYRNELYLENTCITFCISILTTSRNREVHIKAMLYLKCFFNYKLPQKINNILDHRFSIRYKFYRSVWVTWQGLTFDPCWTYIPEVPHQVGSVQRRLFTINGNVPDLEIQTKGLCFIIKLISRIMSKKFGNELTVTRVSKAFLFGTYKTASPDSVS